MKRMDFEREKLIHTRNLEKSKWGFWREEEREEERWREPRYSCILHLNYYLTKVTNSSQMINLIDFMICEILGLDFG